MSHASPSQLLLARAVGALLILSIACPLVGVSPASAGTPTRSLSFTSKSSGPSIQTEKLLVQSDADFSGKTLIGRDVISCTIDPLAHCDLTVALSGGLLEGSFTETAANRLTGRIVSGTRSYRGAHGTIRNSPNGLITVTYRL